MIVNFIIGLGFEILARFRQGIQTRPRPVDHKRAIRFFKLTKLQRDLVGHDILRQRLAIAIDDHATRRGNLERDRSRVLASHDRTIGRPLRHRPNLRRRVRLRFGMRRRNKPQAGQEPSF